MRVSLLKEFMISSRYQVIRNITGVGRTLRSQSGTDQDIEDLMGHRL